jgi:hypothetical protein
MLEAAAPNLRTLPVQAFALKMPGRSAWTAARAAIFEHSFGQEKSFGSLSGYHWIGL